LHSEKYETQDQRISYLSEQIQFQKNETSEKDKSIEDLKNQLDLIQKQIGDLPKEPVENTTPEKEKPESKNVPDSAIQRSVEQARRGGVY
jgi:chromosome segregation ATPase